jgi:hypothetical protein
MNSFLQVVVCCAVVVFLLLPVSLALTPMKSASAKISIPVSVLEDSFGASGTNDGQRYFNISAIAQVQVVRAEAKGL